MGNLFFAQKLIMPIFCVHLLIRHVKVIAEPARLPKFYNLAIELIVSMGIYLGHDAGDLVDKAAQCDHWIFSFQEFTNGS